jgi:hypothetical protein
MKKDLRRGCVSGMILRFPQDFAYAAQDQSAVATSSPVTPWKHCQDVGLCDH